jgi:hypothetical protein
MCSLPDGENAASLGEGALLLDTTDSLLEDGRDLGGRGLRISGIAAGDGVDDGGSGTLLQCKKVHVSGLSLK